MKEKFVIRKKTYFICDKGFKYLVQSDEKELSKMFMYIIIPDNSFTCIV